MVDAVRETFKNRHSSLNEIVAFEDGFADDPLRQSRWNAKTRCEQNDGFCFGFIAGIDGLLMTIYNRNNILDSHKVPNKKTLDITMRKGYTFYQQIPPRLFSARRMRNPVGLPIWGCILWLLFRNPILISLHR